jgi:formylglycine-generating enzyme required for sulfatase activity
MKGRLKRRAFISGTLTAVTGGILMGFRGNPPGKGWLDAGPGVARSGGTADMVRIPAGTFLMGTTWEQAAALAEAHGYHESWITAESPQREIYLPAYLIDRFPVTNREYYLFCRDTGHPPRMHWNDTEPPDKMLEHPVCMVSQEDAKAYAAWAGKRLPTEAEWEKAARGDRGNLFPWGNGFDPAACCWNRSGRDGVTTDPVDAHPRGASPYGVMDMAGNLFEWCSDGPVIQENDDRAVRDTAFLKGGSWISTEILDLRPAAKGNSGHVNNAGSFYGFRCVKDVS